MSDEFDGAIRLRHADEDSNSAGVSADAVGASGPDDAAHAIDATDGVDQRELDHLGAVYEAALRLIELRSMYLVGMALAMKCPTEADLMEFLSRRDFTDAIEAFASVRIDIVREGLGAASHEAMQDAITAHTSRARESLEVLAEILGLTPEDIVSVLIK